MSNSTNTKTIQLSIKDTVAILWPYIADNFKAQIKSIWFIVFYLAFFQIAILQLPLVYTVTISIGILIVAVGLMFFMEGLRLGLMPLGETIGAILPRNAPLLGVLTFAFLLGVGATFAEPAISVLKAAGAGVKPQDTPLLYSLLNDFSLQLVTMVSFGVGLAVVLGIMRFYYHWSLKVFILPGITILTILTLIAHNNPILQPVLGLAWDCGAVTTGPVTVPLVLALGIGVCRVLGDGDTSNAGFGIVTLASLFPILMVLLLGFYHYQANDYYGQPGYTGEIHQSAIEPALETTQETQPTTQFTQEEFEAIAAAGRVDKEYNIRFEGGEKRLVNGRILLSDTVIVLEKPPVARPTLVSEHSWDPKVDIAQRLKESILGAAQAILPLCGFLLLTLWLLVKSKGDTIRLSEEMGIGIAFAVIGMALFILGILLGLTPLGSQLGSNIPTTFASLTPWGMDGVEGPIFTNEFIGKTIAIIFGFFLGYGATLAEPALNALGTTVEKLTVGAFKKRMLMQSVAIGVGLGIATGVLKIAYNIPLAYLLIPPYLLLIVLTLISSEEFVNFGWDSAGVTTGPITVPLVLAMGLGIGSAVPGVSNGFGILALASVGPIITVLLVGIIVARTSHAGLEPLTELEASSKLADQLQEPAEEQVPRGKS